MLSETVCQISKGSNQRSIDVSGGFRMSIVIALIGEMVIVVGASHDSANESVWVGSVAIQRLEAIVAGNDLGMLVNRRQRRAPVMYALWKLGTVAHHV